MPRLFKINTKDYVAETLDWTEFVKVRAIEMQTEFKVLDHGFVKYINHMGTEESIIEAARQSTQKGFLGWKKERHDPECNSWKRETQNLECTCNFGKPGDEKLLEYLYKNRHTTPFEMCELVVQVKAPIMVLRQWERHRTFSYNEWSGRYSQLKDEFYVPTVRYQDTKNRQGSIVDPEIDESFEGDVQNQWKQEQGIIYKTYEKRINQNVAKEVARINMPVSVYTIMWAKGNLHNWLHFLKLRMDSHAQYEIRVYANAVAEIIKSLWPRTYALFEEYSLHSVSLSKSQVEVINKFIDEYSEGQVLKDKLKW